MFLNCHSYYSFHYGTLSIEALLQEAQSKGIHKIALTDINNTSGILDFIRLAPKYDVQPVVGVEFRNQNKLCFIGIAANNEGFEELNRFLSSCLKQGAVTNDSSGNRDAVVPERAPAFRNVWIIYPSEILTNEEISKPTISSGLSTQKNTRSSSRKKKTITNTLYPLRENEFIGIRPQELSRLTFSSFKNQLHKCVALWPVTVRHKTDHNVHRLLTAVGQNALLSMVPKTLFCEEEDAMVTETDMHSRYASFPSLLENTTYILAQSHIAFDFRESKNKKTFSGSRMQDVELLRRETWKGVRYRYGENANPIIRDRVEKELKMIQELGFAAYFLINWDLLRYARRQGYFYVGRGSGANSIVAYCLRITDVDPVDLDLYFERFINPYRTSPPDFDLDFSWKDRDDITAYLFKRYGEEHTALLATYSTYQSNAVIRELGKVLGLPKAEIDTLQDTRDETAVGDKMGKLIKKYSVLLQDFPHHLSIHAGGILISEQPITCYTALNSPPKGFPLTQFSMLEAEDIGLYKFDILSQRGLGHIRDTVNIVRENKDIVIDIHQPEAFKKDEKIKELIRNGLCIGCFYVESPAMRMLLKKLRVDTYLQLVAASSIIRPGVARSGMMREYIMRTHDENRRTYIHPVMKELMEETYGIMVYQEDVIKVAHHFAGLGLSESDVLRRGMSGKFRSRDEFAKIKNSFFDNCKLKGYSFEITNEVWRQIESFAGYSFSKGHSASYAVESYQSLYLKAYFPLEFMVGVINNFGGFYNTEFYVHEARMCGAVIHPPHINKSHYETTIIDVNIYLGLIHLQGMQQELAFEIIEERARSGEYKSLPDFMSRVKIELEQLRLLIRIGAFRFTGRSKKELLWDVHLFLGPNKCTEVKHSLFEEEPPKWVLPQLTSYPLEDAFDEIELLGFALCSPFDLLRDEKDKTEKTVLAKDLSQHIGKTIVLIGYLVTTKPTRTIKGEYMAFGCFLDKEGRFFDTTHFPAIAKAFPFRGRGCYRITGRVDVEFDFCSVTVTHMEKLSTLGVEDLPKLVKEKNETRI